MKQPGTILAVLEPLSAYDATIATCRERARPVVLTAVTAILGVLPIAFGINLDFLGREITHGAPATQWWISLSTAIKGYKRVRLALNLRKGPT